MGALNEISASRHQRLHGSGARQPQIASNRSRRSFYGALIGGYRLGIWL